MEIDKRPAKVKKMAVFADVQNIYYTTRQEYSRQFDYRKLWQRITGEGEIVFANAYAIDRGNEQQKHFQLIKQLQTNLLKIFFSFIFFTI